MLALSHNSVEEQGGISVGRALPKLGLRSLMLGAALPARRLQMRPPTVLGADECKLGESAGVAIGHGLSKNFALVTGSHTALASVVLIQLNYSTD